LTPTIYYGYIKYVASRSSVLFPEALQAEQ
jgi:hypothetical protein